MWIGHCALYSPFKSYRPINEIYTWNSSYVVDHCSRAQTLININLIKYFSGLTLSTSNLLGYLRYTYIPYGKIGKTYIYTPCKYIFPPMSGVRWGNHIYTPLQVYISPYVGYKIWGNHIYPLQVCIFPPMSGVRWGNHIYTPLQVYISPYVRWSL